MQSRFVGKAILSSSLPFIYVLVLLSSVSEAQVTTVTGDQAPPIPGAGHDYVNLLNETVNPATGSVSIRINLPVPPGRGLTVPFSIGYDSNDEHHFLSSPNQPFDNLSYLAQGGWTYIMPHLNLMQNVHQYAPPDSPPDECEVFYYYTDFLFTDLAGTFHSLGLSTASPLFPPNFCLPGVGVDGQLTGPKPNVVSGVETNYLSTAVAETGTQPTAVTVAGLDGTVYSFNDVYHNNGQYPNASFSSLPYQIEDRNGDRVTISDSGGGAFSITDTLGRTELSSSGFGTSGNTISVSGLLAPYQITWGQSSSNWPYNAVVTNLAPQDPTGCAGGNGTYVATLPEITNIKLPNQQAYAFSYDAVSGLLSYIYYPTGGYVRYVWGNSPLGDSVDYYQVNQLTQNSGPTNPTCREQHDTQAVTDRYVSFDGVHEVLHQHFVYQTTWQIINNKPTWTSKTTTVTTYPNYPSTTSYQTVYQYIPYSIPLQPNDNTWTYGAFTEIEQSVAYYDTNGSLLRTENKTFVDPQLQPTVTTVLPGGLTKQSNPVYLCAGKSTQYQSGECAAVLGDDYEYDYGQGAVGVLLKHTHEDYTSFASTQIFPSKPSILDRPSDVIVCQAATCTGSNEVAETDYVYDGYGTNGIMPVTATGHDDTNYPASYTNRGNLTTKTVKCLQSGCSNAVTTYTYDQTGQVLSMTDPCGNAACADMSGTSHKTTYSYSNNFTVLSSGSNVPYSPSGNTDAYLTQITDPLGHVEKFTYDYNSSELTASQNQNDINAGRPGTTYVYNDTFARPTLTTYPDGGQTEYSYNDAAPAPTVTTCQLINGTAGATCSATPPLPTGWKIGIATMDGMEHVVKTELVSDPDGATFTTTSYDGLGRPYTVTNPYRSSSDSTYGITTTLYDALGRTCLIVRPDSAAAPTSCPASAPAGDTFISYSGNQITETNEIGSQRTSQTDGLGRLTSVWEAPNVSGYDFQTTYQYDMLNNVTNVTQNGSNSANARIRSFVYDSLARLTSATNPESGAVTYSYDLNSNLSSKVAPKPNQTGTATVTTNYSYDVTNRLTEKTFAGLTLSPEQYSYDGNAFTACGQKPPNITSPTNLIGRRSATCSGESGVSWSYDAMGRPLLEQRINAGAGTQPNYGTGYTYNLDGSLHTLTYPSGDVLTYTLGGAGRPLGVSDSVNLYVSSGAARATYAPQGALASMDNGPASGFGGIITSNTYNKRLQPILLSASTSSSPIVSLCYDFHSGVAISSGPCSFSAYTSGDNGNVYQVLNNVDSTRSAAYVYDPLNRIAQAHTVNTTSANCWGETYSATATAPGVLPSTSGIDAWANLTNRSGVSGMGTCHTELLSATATTQNQLSGIGMTYDAAGNVTNDGNGNQPTYDAENRISTDAGVTYYYDADGVRMEKSSGTKYWFGQGGEILTETSLSGTINEEYVYFNGQRIARIDRPSGTVHYYFSDHLGSASVITDANGNIEQQYYYYPYGGLVASIGSDPNHYKFTGKERDSESGLDMFGARYYGSSLGRFMTPDWSNTIAPLPYSDPSDPQTLNRYSYVRNNPMSRADVDGHWWEEFENWFKYGHWVDNAHLNDALKQDAQNALADLTKRGVTINGKSAAALLSGKSNKEIIDDYRDINSKLEVKAMIAAATPVIPGARPSNLYRGGTSMEGRPDIDLRIDKNTGLVKPGHGISLNSDPSGLDQFGGAHEIDQSSVPSELEIKQVGRPGHYELVPREPMTVERFNELAGQVKFK